MTTVEQAYNSRRSAYEYVSREARSALESYASDHNFLVSGRTKAADSLRDKIETGRFASVDQVDDIVAFTIIVDISPQERDAIKFLRSAFKVVDIKGKQTLQDERIFDFDCKRVYCRLRDEGQHRPEVCQVIFEVQIRTLLQHAWSKITHGFVYKARDFDPRASRLAAEVMAHLETVDRTFANFEELARQVKLVSRRDMKAVARIIRTVDDLVKEQVIPSEARPSNGRRLGENIFGAIKGGHDNLDAAIAAIRSTYMLQAEAFPISVSLFQLAIVSLHDSGLLEVETRGNPRFYYVTDEMISLFPQAKDIPNQLQIDTGSSSASTPE